MYSGQFDGASASSLFSGGGFMPSQSTQTPESGFSKNRATQGVLPLTVKQISEAYHSNDDKSNFVVDGVDASSVRLLGIVMNKAERVTDVSFSLDDGTGKIDVNRWVNETSDTNEMAMIQNGMYVTINGSLKGFQGKRHIVAFSVRPVTDFNHVTLHFLECIHVHLENTRPKPQVSTAPGVANPSRNDMGGLKTSVSNPVPGNLSTGGSDGDVYKIVLDLFQEPASLKIVEAEMDLTMAKSQGYLRQNASSSGQKLLAVIGVYTGFGSRLKRNVFRGSWMPKGEALKKLEEEKGIVIRFVIGRSANRGDSLDRNIDEENRRTKDFFILEGHEEAAEELPKKAKYFFSAAVETWDAESYVKVDDNINLQLDGLIEILESRRGGNGLYMGCMKSGVVVSEEGKQWYEPEWWKFGDAKSYFRHASGALLILSKNLAQYININSASLQSYAHDDTSVGSWMMGVDATYVDDDRLCCGSSRQEKVCSNP